MECNSLLLHHYFLDKIILWGSRVGVEKHVDKRLESIFLVGAIHLLTLSALLN